MILLDLLSVGLVVAGTVFFLAGTVGLLRFPDLLTRIHALTKADNLGLGFVVLGLLLQVGSIMEGLKLILIWLLALAAAATAGYLIANDEVESTRQGRSDDV